MKRPHIFAVSLVAAGLLMAASLPATAIEEPAFDRVLQARPFELRQYRPMLIAETVADGSMEEASNQGFRRIADFIFGNNTRPAAAGEAPRSQKIAMTAPVMAEPQPSPPGEGGWGVQPAPGGRAADASATAPLSTLQARRWRIHFVMPAKYTLETLPRPKNDLVTIRPVPGRRCAVVVFSGFTDDEKVQGKTRQLLAWIEQQGLRPVGTPQVARYDPPWTLPFWRRNEVLIEVAPPQGTP